MEDRGQTCNKFVGNSQVDQEEVMIRNIPVGIVYIEPSKWWDSKKDILFNNIGICGVYLMSYVGCWGIFVRMGATNH